MLFSKKRLAIGLLTFVCILHNTTAAATKCRAGGEPCSKIVKSPKDVNGGKRDLLPSLRPSDLDIAKKSKLVVPIGNATQTVGKSKVNVSTSLQGMTDEEIGDYLVKVSDKGKSLHKEKDKQVKATKFEGKKIKHGKNTSSLHKEKPKQIKGTKFNDNNQKHSPRKEKPKQIKATKFADNKQKHSPRKKKPKQVQGTKFSDKLKTEKLRKEFRGEKDHSPHKELPHQVKATKFSAKYRNNNGGYNKAAQVNEQSPHKEQAKDVKATKFNNKNEKSNYNKTINVSKLKKTKGNYVVGKQKQTKAKSKVNERMNFLLSSIGKRLNFINKLESKLKSQYKKNNTNILKQKNLDVNTQGKKHQKIMVLISKNGNMISLKRFKRLQSKGLVKGITPVYVRDNQGRALFAVPVAKSLKNKNYMISKKLITVSDDVVKQFLNGYNLDLKQYAKTKTTMKTGSARTIVSSEPSHHRPKSSKKSTTNIDIGNKSYAISDIQDVNNISDDDEVEEKILKTEAFYKQINKNRTVGARADTVNNTGSDLRTTANLTTKNNTKISSNVFSIDESSPPFTEETNDTTIVDNQAPSTKENTPKNDEKVQSKSEHSTATQDDNNSQSDLISQSDGTSQGDFTSSNDTSSFDETLSDTGSLDENAYKNETASDIDASLRDAAKNETELAKPLSSTMFDDNASNNKTTSSNEQSEFQNEYTSHHESIGFSKDRGDESSSTNDYVDDDDDDLMKSNSTLNKMTLTNPINKTGLLETDQEITKSINASTEGNKQNGANLTTTGDVKSLNNGTNSSLLSHINDMASTDWPEGHFKVYQDWQKEFKAKSEEKEQAQITKMIGNSGQQQYKQPLCQPCPSSINFVQTQSQSANGANSRNLIYPSPVFKVTSNATLRNALSQGQILTSPRTNKGFTLPCCKELVFTPTIGQSKQQVTTTKNLTPTVQQEINGEQQSTTSVANNGLSLQANSSLIDNENTLTQSYAPQASESLLQIEPTSGHNVAVMPTLVNAEGLITEAYAPQKSESFLSPVPTPEQSAAVMPSLVNADNSFQQAYAPQIIESFSLPLPASRQSNDSITLQPTIISNLVPTKTLETAPIQSYTNAIVQQPSTEASAAPTISNYYNTNTKPMAEHTTANQRYLVDQGAQQINNFINNASPTANTQKQPTNSNLQPQTTAFASINSVEQYRPLESEFQKLSNLINGDDVSRQTSAEIMNRFQQPTIKSVRQKSKSDKHKHFRYPIQSLYGGDRTAAVKAKEEEEEEDIDDEDDDEDLKIKLKSYPSGKPISKPRVTTKLAQNDKTYKSKTNKSPKKLNSQIKNINNKIDKLVKVKGTKKQRPSSKAAYLKEVETILKESEELSKILQEQANSYVDEETKPIKAPPTKKRQTKKVKNSYQASPPADVPTSLSGFNNILQHIKQERYDQQQRAVNPPQYYRQQQTPTNYYSSSSIYSQQTGKVPSLPLPQAYNQQYKSEIKTDAPSSAPNSIKYGQSYFYGGFGNYPTSTYSTATSPTTKSALKQEIYPISTDQSFITNQRTQPTYSLTKNSPNSETTSFAESALKQETYGQSFITTQKTQPFTNTSPASATASFAAVNPDQPFNTVASDSAAVTTKAPTNTFQSYYQQQPMQTYETGDTFNTQSNALSFYKDTSVDNANTPQNRQSLPSPSVTNAKKKAVDKTAKYPSPVFSWGKVVQPINVKPLNRDMINKDKRMEEIHHLKETKPTEAEAEDEGEEIEKSEKRHRERNGQSTSSTFSSTNYLRTNGITDSNHHAKAMSFLSSFMKYISGITHNPNLWIPRKKDTLTKAGSKRDVVLGRITDEIERESRDGSLGSLIGRIFDDDNDDNDVDISDSGYKGTVSTRTLPTTKAGDDDALESGIITMLQTDEDEKMVLQSDMPTIDKGKKIADNDLHSLVKMNGQSPDGITTENVGAKRSLNSHTGDIMLGSTSPMKEETATRNSIGDFPQFPYFPINSRKEISTSSLPIQGGAMDDNEQEVPQVMFQTSGAPLGVSFDGTPMKTFANYPSEFTEDPFEILNENQRNDEIQPKTNTPAQNNFHTVNDLLDINERTNDELGKALLLLNGPELGKELINARKEHRIFSNDNPLWQDEDLFNSKTRSPINRPPITDVHALSDGSDKQSRSGTFMESQNKDSIPATNVPSSAQGSTAEDSAATTSPVPENDQQYSGTDSANQIDTETPQSTSTETNGDEATAAYIMQESNNSSLPVNNQSLPVMNETVLINEEGLSIKNGSINQNMTSDSAAQPVVNNEQKSATDETNQVGSATVIKAGDEGNTHTNQSVQLQNATAENWSTNNTSPINNQILADVNQTRPVLEANLLSKNVSIDQDTRAEFDTSSATNEIDSQTPYSFVNKTSLSSKKDLNLTSTARDEDHKSQDHDIVTTTQHSSNSVTSEPSDEMVILTKKHNDSIVDSFMKFAKPSANPVIAKPSPETDLSAVNKSAIKNKNITNLSNAKSASSNNTENLETSAIRNILNSINDDDASIQKAGNLTLLQEKVSSPENTPAINSSSTDHVVIMNSDKVAKLKLNDTKKLYKTMQNEEHVTTAGKSTDAHRNDSFIKKGTKSDQGYARFKPRRVSLIMNNKNGKKSDKADSKRDNEIKLTSVNSTHSNIDLNTTSEKHVNVTKDPVLDVEKHLADTIRKNLLADALLKKKIQLLHALNDLSSKKIETVMARFNEFKDTLKTFGGVNTGGKVSEKPIIKRNTTASETVPVAN